MILGERRKNMAGTTSSLYCVHSGKTDTAEWPAGDQEKSPKHEKQGFCPGGQNEVSKSRPGLLGLCLIPVEDTFLEIVTYTRSTAGEACASAIHHIPELDCAVGHLDE